MEVTYNYGLVFLSYSIAIIASYAALNLGKQLKRAIGLEQLYWLIGGAVAMGTGIWSMHFIGMIAFQIPQKITYDIAIVILSWIVGIMGAAIALWIVSRSQLRVMQWLVGGSFMGVAIASMHYIGMAAIRVDAIVEYDWRWVIFSVVFAILVSFVALALVFWVQNQETNTLLNFRSALVMATGICGMHYSGMKACHFSVLSSSDLDSISTVDHTNTLLGIGIAIATIIILGCTFLTLFFDQQLGAAQEYNRLLEEKVEERTAQLQNLTEQLEQRVKDRTFELSQANQKLEKALLENAELYQQSQGYSHQLQESLNQLQAAQIQLIQQEKMSALGQMMAGITHEINNPLGFVLGNLSQAEEAVEKLLHYLEQYQYYHPPSAEITAYGQEIELEYILVDLPQILTSMKTGINQIRDISQSMRIFSRGDQEKRFEFDLHEGLDSTLLILKHRLKANKKRSEIQVIKEYKNLPKLMGFPGQLNQVFMNIIANAIDVFDESCQSNSEHPIQQKPHQIILKTEFNPLKKVVTISIRDNGYGMSEEIKSKVFEHLFTTKVVGKGTGLGLSIAHQIVVDKHGGKLDCESTVGEGTEFLIQLPLEY